MRSVLTTAAELIGLWLVVVAICALVGGPVAEVAALAGGLALIVLGVTEAP
jgi:hypothetical protein